MLQRCATRRVLAALVVAAVTLAGVLVSAIPAGAKVLPYRLGVSPTTAVVGQPITITMELDPQNVLGDPVDFEIAVYPSTSLTAAGWPRRGAVNGVAVVMVRSTDEPLYRGVFTPTRRGRYVVVGRSGQPTAGSDPHCLPEDSATQWRCWPAPVPIEVSRAQKQR